MPILPGEPFFINRHDSSLGFQCVGLKPVKHHPITTNEPHWARMCAPASFSFNPALTSWIRTVYNKPVRRDHPAYGMWDPCRGLKK